MKDHELIQLAAKAAGYKGRMTDQGLAIKEAGGEPDPWVAIVWNPLKNNADALRLAVQMHLTFGVITEGVIAKTPCGQVFHINPLEKDHDTMMRATRHVITRAAAECGVPE